MRRLLILLTVGLALGLPPASALANPPSARFSASSPSPEAGEAVTFRAEGCKKEEVVCTWSGDDGVNGSGREIVHSYALAGTYTVRLTALRPATEGDKDEDGTPEESETQELILVVRPATPLPPPPPVNRAPVARFESSTSGLRATFDARGSSDPDGDDLAYAWRFGDDRTATGARPSHTYARAGTYRVVLTVRDGRGGERTASARLTVAPATVVSTNSTPDPIAPAGDPATEPLGPSGDVDPAPTLSPAAPGTSPVSSPTSAVSRLRAMSPFPIVRIAGSVVGRGTRISLVSVRGPRSARVVVRCSGSGCPFTRRALRTGSSLAKRLKLRGRLMRPGTVLDIRVMQPGRIGKRTKLTFRPRRAPSRSDGCVDPAGAVRRCA